MAEAESTRLPPAVMVTGEHGPKPGHEVRLSILTPTIGRPSIDRLAASIERAGYREGHDEWLVAFDTHPVNGEPSQPLLWTREVVGALSGKLVLHDAGHHCWGHCQLNKLMEQATGDYLVFNDDDDIFTDGIFDRIRELVAEGPRGPLLFQFLTPARDRFWDKPEPVLSHIGGHCLVTPNVAGKVGRFACWYAGDFNMIVDTLARWPREEVRWVPELIAIARP